MSHLAPFVATVLRDKAMVEMMSEMEKLKTLVDDRLKVQVTGRKGTPVYCEGSLRDGYTSHRGRCFEVIFEHNGETTQNGVIPLTALGELEIKLGGSIIQRLDARTITGACNAPFFTDDDFYRDVRYNRPEFLAFDRKEIILKIQSRIRRDPVPFLIAQFVGTELSLSDYQTLHNLGIEALQNLNKSGKASSLVLDGLTFSKTEIQESLSVLQAMNYGVDEGNGHRHYVHTVDVTRIPVRKTPPSME